NLQQEHQAQLEHLIGRVRRWSSRYERKAGTEYGNADSGGTSSLRSSSRSDGGWRPGFHAIEETVTPGAHRGVQSSRPSRPVLDAITQIGIATQNASIQTDGLGRRLSRERSEGRNLKEALCQVGHVTSTTSCQTDEQPFQSTRKKGQGMFEAITQTGVVHADAHTQAGAQTGDTNLVKRLHMQPIQAATPGSRPSSDAFCQIGVIQNTTHTQTDGKLLETLLLERQAQEKSWARTKPARDAVCQIGMVTVTSAVQTSTGQILSFGIPSRSKSSDAMTQIGCVTRLQGVQTETRGGFNVAMQTGVVTQAQFVQANLIPEVTISEGKVQVKSRPSAQVYEVACQVASTNRSREIQADLITKPPQRPEAVDGHVQYEPQTNRRYEVNTQFVSTMAKPKQTYSVQTQIGVVKSSQGAQYDYSMRRAKSMETVSCQTRSSPVDDGKAYHASQWEKPSKAFYDVAAQVVHHRAPMREMQDINIQTGVRTIEVASQIGIVSRAEAIQTVPWKPVQKSLYDVKVQSGVVTQDKQIDATDSAVSSKPRSKSYDVLTQVGVTRDSQFTQCSDTQLDIIKPRLTTHNVALQQGTVSKSREVQADLAEKRAVRPTVYDVEAQTGIVSHTQITQAELETKKPILKMDDAEVQFIPRPVDSNIESEQLLEITAPKQNLRPPIPNEEVSVQTERWRPVCYDVQAQTGTVNQTKLSQTVEHGTIRYETAKKEEIIQTEIINRPCDSVLQSEEELKLEIVAPVQALKPTVPKDDRGIQAQIRPDIFDIAAQCGTVRHTVETQTEVWKPRMTNIGILTDGWTEKNPLMKSKNYDVQAQTGIVNQAKETQTKEEIIAKKIMETIGTQVESLPDTGTINKKLQVSLMPDIVEAISQRENISQGTQVRLDLPRFDVAAQSGVVSTDGSSQTKTGEEINIKTTVAKYEFGSQAEFTKTQYDVEAQSGIVSQVGNSTVQWTSLTASYDYKAQTETEKTTQQPAPITEKRRSQEDFAVQTQIEPTRYDVEAQSGVISQVGNTQTVQEAKSTVAKYEFGSQAEFTKTQYDVEAQSGIVSQVGSTQTVEEIKSIPIDTTIQSEQQIQVDVVAPVRALKPETPKDDFAVQAYLVPTKYDVEAQCGSVSQATSTQTVEDVKPTVAKYEFGLQTELVEKRYDVEAQSGVISQVGSTQTVQEAKSTVAKYEFVQVGSTQTVEEIKSIPIDTTIQSEQQIQVDVVAPVRALKPETPKDDFAVQAYLVPTKYDVEAQSGIINQIGCTQTTGDYKTITPVEDSLVLHKQQEPSPAINKKLQVSLVPQIADANTQTETEYKPSIKKYEVASQVEFVQKRYDVEAQSGIVSQVGSTQTVEEFKSITN
ncbi:hypothetical protein FGIG_11159, partial [Fasciola gigantica]